MDKILTYKRTKTKRARVLVKACAMVVLSFVAAVGLGAEVSTVRWAAGEPNENWTVSAERIVSPTWPKLDIVGAAVTLSCSTNAPDRWLQATFLRDGKTVSGPIRLDAVCAAKCRETTDFTRLSNDSRVYSFMTAIIRPHCKCRVNVPQSSRRFPNRAYIIPFISKKAPARPNVKGVR